MSSVDVRPNSEPERSEQREERKEKTKTKKNETEKLRNVDQKLLGYKFDEACSLHCCANQNIRLSHGNESVWIRKENIYFGWSGASQVRVISRIVFLLLFSFYWFFDDMWLVNAHLSFHTVFTVHSSRPPSNLDYNLLLFESPIWTAFNCSSSMLSCFSHLSVVPTHSFLSHGEPPFMRQHN